MNVISTTGTSAGTVAGGIKFDTLTIVKNGLVLKYGNKQLGSLSFSELDKIYIKVYKLNWAYNYLLLLVPFLLAFLFVEFRQLDIEMFVALVPVIPVFAKINFYKRYGLIIRLKDGTFYRKKLLRKLKSDTVDLINDVKRARLKNSENTVDSNLIGFPVLCRELAS